MTFNESSTDSDLYPYGAAVGKESQQWDLTYCKKEELPLEGLRFFDRRCYRVYVCDNGIVSFDPIPRPTRPHLLTNSVWGGKAVIAPFQAQSQSYVTGVPEHKRTKIYIEMYEKGDDNVHSPEVLRRARDDGRSIKDFYLPYYEPAWVAVITWINIAPSCSLYSHGVCPVPLANLPVNSFQLMLTSDGTYSFALFIYPARKIEWISPDELLGTSAPLSLIAVAGYNAGDGDGVPDHSLDMDGSGTAMMRRVWLQNSGRWGFALQEQVSTDIPQPAVLQCSMWIRAQGEDKAYGVLQGTYDRVKGYSACPCTAEQAFYDETYSYQVNSDEECAQSLPFYSFVHLSTEYAIRRTCCYTPSHFYWRVFGSFGQTKVGGGRLLTGQQGGHIIVNDRSDDEEAHSRCCVELSGVRDDYYCRKFTEQRPLSLPSIGGNPCRNYPSQLVWVIGAWGDPHITTLDGVRYAFNGLGEYVVLDVDGVYMIQGRTALAKGSSRATVFSAIATRQTNHSAIQVNLIGESGLKLFVNNSEVDLPVLSEIVVDNSAIVVRKEENSMLMAFYSGITVKVVAQKAMLLIEVSAPPELKNKTRGLMGRWDDDTTNDYEFFNGTVLPADASEEDLYHMGTTWQVTRDEGPRKSIFHYLHGESLANFTSPSFLPAFTDQIWSFADPDLERQARAVCGNDTACLFDVAETGDVEVGEMEKEDQRRFQEKVLGRG
ncbi:mucin-like protein [Branchiostoma floridae x Branchiostoma belcheri]